MRQAYFTSKTLVTQAKHFLDQLERKSPFDLGRRKTALLGLDLQEYFLAADSHAFVPSAPAIIPNVNSLSGAFQAAGLPVFFTQHLNKPDDAGMMAEWWRDLITLEHPLAGLSPDLVLGDGVVVPKTQYDAFYQTELADRLIAEGVEDLVICGLMTHLCCETTARAAFVRGFRVWFTVDATATYNSEFHLGSLRNLSHGFASPVLTAEVMAVL